MNSVIVLHSRRRLYVSCARKFPGRSVLSEPRRRFGTLTHSRVWTCFAADSVIDGPTRSVLFWNYAGNFYTRGLEPVESTGRGEE